MESLDLYEVVKRLRFPLISVLELWIRHRLLEARKLAVVSILVTIHPRDTHCIDVSSVLTVHMIDQLQVSDFYGSYHSIPLVLQLIDKTYIVYSHSTF